MITPFIIFAFFIMPSFTVGVLIGYLSSIDSEKKSDE